MAKEPDAKSDQPDTAQRGRFGSDQPSGAAQPDDGPGKEFVPAAVSGAQSDVQPGIAPPGQGAQVVLTGDAQAAARGGSHAEIELNTMARDAAIAAGHVVPGTTAEAAAAATTGAAGADEIDEAEEKDIAAARAKARDARVARAAKPPAR